VWGGVTTEEGHFYSWTTQIWPLKDCRHEIIIFFSSPELGPRWADLDRISLSTTGDVQFSIWVSFFEIYNELIYDLLEPALPGQNRKRQTLRLCEDQTGNPYVKGIYLKDVNSGPLGGSHLRRT